MDGAVVRSATGAANNKLQPLSWDVRQWAGKSARLVIVDEETAAWEPLAWTTSSSATVRKPPVGPLAEEEDFGTMGLALLDAQPQDTANPSGDRIARSGDGSSRGRQDHQAGAS